MNQKLEQLVNADTPLKDIKGLTKGEYIELIRLTNIKHAMLAAQAETEEKIKKLSRPAGPVTLIFKPIIFKSRRSDLEELEVESKKPKGQWSHINHYKTIYGEDTVRRSGDIVKVCATIQKEVKYFRTVNQRNAFFKWLKAEKPHQLDEYTRNCVTGRTNLAKVIRDLKKNHVGDVVKGFRMFIKKYYRPLERMAVRTFSGHVTFISLNK